MDAVRERVKDAGEGPSRLNEDISHSEQGTGDDEGDDKDSVICVDEDSDTEAAMEVHAQILPTSIILAPNTHTVFCWGDTEHGQLGLGGIEDTNIFMPRELNTFKCKEVVDVGCGIDHTLFVLADGTVYSCGNNECGQLGHDKSRTKPEQIDALETQVVMHVGCGYRHSMAMTDTGQLFSWGDNNFGQLGRGYTDCTYTTAPKLVRNLTSHVVIQVACGQNHTLALTQAGKLFTWGANDRGQLGLAYFSPKQDTPQIVNSLQGLAISQIAAEGEHSLALTVSGALFSWGRNRFGQLGIGDDKNRFYPTLVKTLRSHVVKHVAAGDDHSVALTQDGGVFTFGAGMYGQLGHNTKNNEFLPKKVFELMGSVVTMIAAGKRHTAAYVTSSGRIYTFGLGGSGQLGTGSSSNRLSPSTVRGPFVPIQGKALTVHFSLENQPLYVVKRLYSGGNQCFATVTSPTIEIPPDDFRICHSNDEILTLSANFIKEIVSLSPEEKPSIELSERVETLLSSQSCLNGSFLMPESEHYNCSGRHHGVDLDAARDGFGRLRSLPNKYLQQYISDAIGRNLLPNLTDAPPDVEALRFYLTLPWSPLFDDPTNTFRNIICPFAMKLLSLQKTPGRVIDLWWSTYTAEHLLRLIDTYKQTIWHILRLSSSSDQDEITLRQKFLHVCMEFLKKLNKVNEDKGYIVPYDSFYIPELKDKIDVGQDYIHWIQQQSSQIRALQTRKDMISFCNYAFVFDGQAKTMLLQTDAVLQMQMAVDEVNRRNLSSLYMPMIDPINPCLILYVTRDNIVHDTINQLAKQRSCNYKKPLKVIFLGEEAVDQGGVKKEFFLLLLKEILDPKYGMFKYYEDSRLIWFNQETFEDDVMFMLIGVLCGLAIYNGLIIDLNFPLPLYKKLLHRPVLLEDLCELDPPVGRGLQQLMDYDGDDVEEVFCLDFAVTREVFGEVKQIDLIKDGHNVVVNKWNKKEYVDAYLNYVFNQSVERQFTAFNDGFHKVCGGRVLELFQPKELQAMVVGNENYDWDQLEKNCDYKGEYYRNHRTIIFFWEVFRELSVNDKKKFLMFLTGSDRIPIHGMKAVKIFIQPTGGGDNFLPVAHTCFNLLDLPKYTSKAILRDKLILAIGNTTGFGLV